MNGGCAICEGTQALAFAPLPTCVASTLVTNLTRFYVLTAMTSAAVFNNDLTRSPNV